MTKIKTLKNRKSGESVAPRTHVKAVYDDNGNTLDSLLGVQDEKLSELGSEVGKIIPSVEGIINLSLYKNIQWIDDGANGWKTLKGYNSIFIPCYRGMKYHIVASVEQKVVVSVVTALPNEENEPVAYADGESRRRLNASEEATFVVGEDAKYICVQSTSNYVNVLPQIVEVVANDRIDELESSVRDIKESVDDLDNELNGGLNEIRTNAKTELWNIKTKFETELDVQTTEGASWVSKTLDNPIPKKTEVLSLNGYAGTINFRKTVDNSFVSYAVVTESDLPVILSEDCTNIQMSVGGSVTISLRGETSQAIVKNKQSIGSLTSEVDSLMKKVGGSIELSLHENVNWIDDGANGWRQLSGYYSKFIPCYKHAAYHIVGNSTQKTIVSVITALPSVVGEAVSYAEGESRRVLAIGEEVEFITGEDAKYICIQIQAGSIDRTPQLVELVSSLGGTYNNGNGISFEEEEGKIIISTKFNDPLEVRLQALKYNPITPDGTRNNNRILSLIHFSDVHGCEDNVRRIVEFQKKYADYIDEILHTGDIAYSYFYWAYRWNEIGASHILNTIGNHDAEEIGTGIFIDESDSYDMYFNGYINNWGCQYTEGKCYYYKDYAEKNLRLIVIDSVHDSDDQKTWFNETLTEANSLGYAVVCASHYKPYHTIDYFVNETPFCSYDIENNGQIDITYINHVDSFIENGGVFVAWLCGHTHRDLCGTINGHSKQLVIVIECAQCGGISTLVTSDGESYTNQVLSNLSETSPRKVGTITQDCFNVVSIDVSNKALKVFRVGSNVDFRMRVKDTLSWDFDKYVLVKTN